MFKNKTRYYALKRYSYMKHWITTLFVLSLMVFASCAQAADSSVEDEIGDVKYYDYSNEEVNIIDVPSQHNLDITQITAEINNAIAVVTFTIDGTIENNSLVTYNVNFTVGSITYGLYYIDGSSKIALVGTEEKAPEIQVIKSESMLTFKLQLIENAEDKPVKNLNGFAKRGFRLAENATETAFWADYAPDPVSDEDTGTPLNIGLIAIIGVAVVAVIVIVYYIKVIRIPNK